MAAITANVHGIHEADFTFFIIGFISMLVTTPVIFYRYIRYPNKTDMNKPLICIFTALFSILIVGYLNSAESISYEFLMALYLIACVCYIFALYKFIDYRNIDFYPSFAAFTFPFVISALATKGVVKNFAPNILLDNILTVETVIAVLLVAYVVMRYAKFLKNS
jgi:exfoliative toxin A/B